MRNFILRTLNYSLMITAISAFSLTNLEATATAQPIYHCPNSDHLNFNTSSATWYTTPGTVTATNAEGIQFSNKGEVDDDFFNPVMSYVVVFDPSNNEMHCSYRHGGGHTGRGNISAELPKHVKCGIVDGQTLGNGSQYKECTSEQTCAVSCYEPQSLKDQAIDQIKKMPLSPEQLNSLPEDLKERLN